MKIDFDDFDNINELSAAILNLRHLGSTTNTAAALRNLREDLLGSIPSGSSTVAVVMTDAPSNRDSDEVGPQAEMARDEGVTFIAVGFTDAIVNEPEELHLITGRSDQELIITIPDYSGFSGTAYTEQLTNLIQRESGESACWPANTARWPDYGVMLGRRRRRRPSILPVFRQLVTVYFLTLNYFCLNHGD